MTEREITGEMLARAVKYMGDFRDMPDVDLIARVQLSPAFVEFCHMPEDHWSVHVPGHDEHYRAESDESHFPVLTDELRTILLDRYEHAMVGARYWSE